MPSVARNDLKKFLDKGNITDIQRELAQLRLEYSDIAMVRNTFINSLKGHERIYPTILPTQSSGRWSYISPALSNFPKKCINPECPKYHHEKTDLCWSVRDCIEPDPGTFWIDHDLNAVEHFIYCLILQWKERLDDLKSGIDIHTPVTCSLFNLPMPPNTQNPHSFCTCGSSGRLLQKVCEHCQWREVVKWQGKDDTRRTMSKNFTYGGQYFYVSLAKNSYKPRLPTRVYNGLVYNPMFVYSIPNIQSYLISDNNGNLIPPDYESLAIRFVESNVEIQKRKAYLMEKYRKDKVSRTLYGGKRHGWFSNQDTAKELFNHTIQGTVASYINESCILLQKAFPESYIIHNQHDSLKWAFTYTSYDKAAEEQEILSKCKKICQRSLIVQEHEAEITATFKIVRAREEST